MRLLINRTTPADLVQLRLRDWIEFEATIVAKPGRGHVLTDIRAWPSPAFYAFRSALLYSIHKYTSLVDLSVLDTIEG